MASWKKVRIVDAIAGNLECKSNAELSTWLFENKAICAIHSQ